MQTNISSTARYCAFARAYHSNFTKDKVFDDFLAYDLMGKEAYDMVYSDILKSPLFQDKPATAGNMAEAIRQFLAPIPLSRVQFAENKLTEFAGRHGACQYVICGAGYDTFAFRNDNPNIQIFEIDHPSMQAFKKKRIHDLEWNIPKNVHFVPVDFEQDDIITALLDAGFSREKKTFFSILGVAYYLRLPVFAKTISDLSMLGATDSMLVFDYPNEKIHSGKLQDRSVQLAKLTASLGEPMNGGYSVIDTVDTLIRRHFKIESHLSPSDIQRQFFDTLDENYRAFENIYFISAIKEENPMNSYIFTSESVTEGHPDKVCDLISDALLDAYIAADPKARAACETTVKNNTIMLLGEISSSADIDIESIVRQTVRDIGYDRDELGFNGNTAEIILRLDKQSADIAMGVDAALESRGSEIEEIGAGDQGMVFGYAAKETPELMPLPLSLAHKLARRLSRVRKDGLLPYLRPDGKTQVSVRYENGIPSAIDVIVVSAQHDPDTTQDILRRDIIQQVIQPIIPENLLTENTRILVNPTGRFVTGGPVGDSGLTGRKIIVDTYGGYARHGGGAFSGKDPTKVDRSAAYAARFAAKNIVAAGLAEKCEVQLAYAIGVAAPVAVFVDTFGTGQYPDSAFADAVQEVFDLRPEGIIRMLRLQTPMYKNLAAYGHMGREDLGVSFEERTAVPRLKAYFEKRSEQV